jgi:hypothetical protein
LIRGFLEDRGFLVREQRFSFHPYSLNALPVIGAGLGWLTLLELPLLLGPGIPRFAAPAVWLAGALATGILAWGLATGTEIPGAEQREDANLIATREKGSIRCWIVAHTDTKAQGHSLAGRLVAVWLLAGAVFGMTLLAGLRIAFVPPLTPVAAVTGLAVAAGVLAARGRLRGTSPGARDNGTGVLAALTLAQDCDDPEVGFLFTGAEEFGLVGARIAVAAGTVAPSAAVVNLDTFDQQGDFYLVYHDRSGAELADRLWPMVEGLAPRSRKRALPPGILTDSLPFARQGSAAVTLARLDWQTLRLIHTPLDLPAGLDLSTAQAAGIAVSRWLDRPQNGVDPGQSVT